MSERVGEQFGNYRLTRLLGQGGFADVYLGEHVRLGTQAAVKLLHNRLNDAEVQQFLDEARIVARLEHTNIVRIFDFDVKENIPFLVMSFAPNGTLRQRHPRGTQLPLASVVSYANQIADALQYAHDEKLIHRDVKPENILIGRRNEIMLSDFGIAVISQSGYSVLLGQQGVAGTPFYMAPELWLGHPRRASDQYALGIMVYEWLNGTLPFQGNQQAISYQHMNISPPPFRESVPSISPAIEQIVMRALAKDPDHRFASIQEFAEALTGVVKRTYLPPMPQKTKEQWFDEGNGFYTAGMYREAIEAYNHAIQLDRRFIDAFINRGATYDDLKEYAKAIEDYNHVIELNPLDADAYYNRGNSYRALKDYGRAIADYNRAIEFNPRYADAYYNRGNAFRDIKQYTQAIADYNYAIGLNPNDVDAYCRRGLALYALNDFQHAVQDFDYALYLDPDIIVRIKSQREYAYRKLGRKP